MTTPKPSASIAHSTARLKRSSERPRCPAHRSVWAHGSGPMDWTVHWIHEPRSGRPIGAPFVANIATSSKGPRHRGSDSKEISTSCDFLRSAWPIHGCFCRLLRPSKRDHSHLVFCAKCEERDQGWWWLFLACLEGTGMWLVLLRDGLL